MKSSSSSALTKPAAKPAPPSAPPISSPSRTLDAYRRRPLTPAFVEINLPPPPPESFAIVLRNGRRLELTWNALPHIADQLEGLLLRLEA